MLWRLVIINRVDHYWIVPSALRVDGFRFFFYPNEGNEPAYIHIQRAECEDKMWFPRLFDATPEQRGEYQFIGRGRGIHWPRIDEDISVRGLLEGRGDMTLRDQHGSF